MQHPVATQQGANNAHDVRAFVAGYAEDFVSENGTGQRLSSNQHEMRARDGGLFAASATLPAQLMHRRRISEYVSQEERISGARAST
jgi:hypothetical protein